MDTWYQTVSPQAQKKEREKAKKLRQSQWWKGQLAQGLCHYCGEGFSPSSLSMDHIIPVARGGLSKKSNLVTACKPCNSKKQAKTPVDMIIESWGDDNKS